jgi:hypothetical protein
MLVQITADEGTGIELEVSGRIVKEPRWDSMVICKEEKERAATISLLTDTN